MSLSNRDRKIAGLPLVEEVQAPKQFVLLSESQIIVESDEDRQIVDLIVSTNVVFEQVITKLSAGEQLDEGLWDSLKSAAIALKSIGKDAGVVAAKAGQAVGDAVGEKAKKTITYLGQKMTAAQAQVYQTNIANLLKKLAGLSQEIQKNDKFYDTLPSGLRSAIGQMKAGISNISKQLEKAAV